MKAILLLNILVTCRICALAPPHRFPPVKTSKILCLHSSKLPTIEELSNDGFMKQVQYGSDLSEKLLENPSQQDYLKEPLSVQLSHSDGVRGFMVSYLTADQSAADNESIPAVLLQALQEQVERNSPDLIPLACMNVVMPTGMITMHQNPDQSANSARTSKRGVRILKALAKFSPDAKENARAILQVANNSMENDDTQGGLVQYWTDFFEKWGYQDAQRKDISKVMESILEED